MTDCVTCKRRIRASTQFINVFSEEAYCVRIQGGPKNGTVFWYALTSSNVTIFKIISLSESGENL